MSNKESISISNIMLKRLDKKHPCFDDVMSLFYDQWKNIYQTTAYKTLADIKRYYKNHKEAVIYIYLKNDILIGCYTLLHTTHFLCDVIVKKEYRGQGIGAIIIQDAKERCLKLKWKHIHLYTLFDTYLFYKQYGFVIKKNIGNNKYLMEYKISQTSPSILIQLCIVMFVVYILSTPW